jgi:L-alanine-DL-glutamate epimerase-like enolase superfamily enzyme
VRLGFQRRVLRLASPLPSSFGTVTERQLVAVTVTDGDGATGYGEAAPLQAYDGVSVEQVEAALGRYRAVLARSDEWGDGEALAACRRASDLPQALAAIDLALWDRAGRRESKPVAELLTDAPARGVRVSATLTASDREGAAEQARRAAAAGFTCLKVKVATPDDAGRLAAVRAAAGAGTALRVDANGAWGVEEAVRAIGTLAPAGLELVEEPTHGLRAVAEVRERVSARIAIDETASERGALAAGVADAVCLKIARCGGISDLLVAAALVRASGAEAYVGSTLDGPLGVSAALHAAAALSSAGPVPHCGLATLPLFEGLDDPLPAREGWIAVPTRPGLGVDPL